MQLPVLSLCCGAGGIDEGLRQAGVQNASGGRVTFCTKWAVDPWADALATIKANHQEASCFPETLENFYANMMAECHLLLEVH